MTGCQVAIYVLSITALIIGLILSNAGSTGGLAALSGHDLEIFKKTKDYGLVRVLRITMFMIIAILMILTVLHNKISL